MKKEFYLLLCLAVLISSCNKEEEETYTDICYISGVTLGVVKRTVPSKTSEGADTLITSSYNGGLFPMTIDQRNHTIENRDSLLYGTSLDAVLLTVSYEGGVVAYRAADATEETEWTSYSATDSINLSNPISLYVLSDDGHSKRVYTLKVNVHQQEGDSVSWQRVDSVMPFTNLVSMRSVVLNGRLGVLGQAADGEVTYAERSTRETQGEWSQNPTNLPSTTEVETLRQSGDALYVSTSDGAIYTSADAKTWTELTGEQAGLKLAAVTESYLYALTGTGLSRTSRTTPGTWETESLDDDVANLPGMALNSCYYTQDNGFRRLQLIGCRANSADSTAVVWSKVWDDDEDEATAEWAYFVPSPDNRYLCPSLQHLSIFNYDDRGVALGGASFEGRGSHNPLDVMLVSNDQGITWKTDESLHLPAGIVTDDGPLTALADEDDLIWIITRNEVWRGRLNRLGFARQ